jgi:diguanylate cyclase (GGDEF)-like protein
MVRAGWHAGQPLIELLGPAGGSFMHSDGKQVAGLDDEAGTEQKLHSSDGFFDNLHERVRLLEAVVDNFPGGISLFDKNLRMVLCNEQQKKLLDYPEALFAKGYPTLEDIFRFNASRGEYGPGDTEEHVRHRIALAREQRAHVVERTRPNGTVLEIRGVPLKGGGFVTTYLDVTEQRRAQALVAHMAHHDALTNLPNRILFRDRLQQAIARAKRGETIALLYLDLDGFKPVNDSLGHAAGDVLLKEIADRLRATARDTDTVARLGGDEFVLIQVGLKETSEAAALARRITRAVTEPCTIAGQTIAVATSIGIAVAPHNGLDPDELLRMADHALYRCKTDGRGSYMFFGSVGEAWGKAHRALPKARARVAAPASDG